METGQVIDQEGYVIEMRELGACSISSCGKYLQEHWHAVVTNQGDREVEYIYQIEI